MILSTHWGEIAALLTALFWTVTALSFEVASRQVGSLSVNIIRLFFAFWWLLIYNWIAKGSALPTDASMHNWIWLGLSGLVGFVFGDYFLFKSYPILSSRVSMLIMTTVPPITAITGWIFLGETLSLLHILGMVLTVGGISLSILGRTSGEKGVKLNYPIKGVLYALGGAVGQSIGLIISKYGMQGYDAFSSTQIRIIFGLAGFIILIAIMGRYREVGLALQSKKGMSRIMLGSVFGPFLGVSFSLIAVKYASTGVASTLMAVVPIMIIAPSVFILHHKVTLREVIGAIVSVSGVVLFFI